MIKRSKWEITYAILKSIQNGEKSKTRIMYEAYLDWRNFSRYIKFLIDKNLVVEKNGGKLEITQKGEKILKIMEELIELIKD
ncbi:conserved hypothetical protein [Ferroglobus placidus DSM 10642]|uniref:ArnR1-like winged helix-turn-helix domain-containing protein n=1 Tax=Ferroglobus placidus (strain DSM 10642 / AEDII12DO) TaxID=589924 RepID=D3RZC6_FERPA|nr:winged helix-turn-helix domain-containing protein [Ferroglobus placidus]ADC65839.1 conserved hypothetical protein [Ferroglobus placidus DSM 10642]